MTRKAPGTKRRVFAAALLAAVIFAGIGVFRGRPLTVIQAAPRDGGVFVLETDVNSMVPVPYSGIGQSMVMPVLSGSPGVCHNIALLTITRRRPPLIRATRALGVRDVMTDA